LANAVHINLPKTVPTTPPEQQKAVTVTVDGQAQIYLDNQIVSSDQLEAQLIALKAANAELSLHLRADERVPYGPVAKVMAEVEHAGITHVSVLTDQQ
jgi:biopolymer transport protein ExbD